MFYVGVIDFFSSYSLHINKIFGIHLEFAMTLEELQMVIIAPMEIVFKVS